MVEFFKSTMKEMNWKWKSYWYDTLFHTALVLAMLYWMPTYPYLTDIYIISGFIFFFLNGLVIYPTKLLSIKIFKLDPENSFQRIHSDSHIMIFGFLIFWILLIYLYLRNRFS